MIARISTLLFLCVVLFARLDARQNLNMEFLGNKNDYAQTGAYSACWGYTAPDGREYALLGCQTGTSIIDITDAPTLREVAFIPGPTSNWREMKTFKSYAYIVTENGSAPGAGVQILDLSNLPNTAALAKTFVWTDTTNGVPTPIPRAHTVSVSGHYLYLNGGNFNGIRILDIKDPLNPVKAGVYVGLYIHDSHIRNDTIFASAINNGGGLDIIEARSKANPTRIKLIQYPGSGTHNAWTTADRKYVITTDEVGSSTKTLKVWNIQNVTNPAMVIEFTSNTAIDHNIFIKGNLAYVAWYAAGLRVIDLTDPTAPKEVGYYDTYPASNVASYLGAWGADPYFPSGKVIISDMQTGLYVVRYTGDKRGIVNGVVTDEKTGAPLNDVLLCFPDATITRWTASSGRYLFGYAPGNYTVVLEKEGYAAKESVVTVTEGQATTVNFSLTPVGSIPINSNVQKLGNYQGRKETSPQGTSYSSVWGYTDADGREYGIIGVYSGTAIVDLSYLPDSLHEVAFIPGPKASYAYREMKTYLHYLYIVSEGGDGVQIVDLAGLPNSVRFVGNFSFTGYDRAHTIGETDGYLYLNGGNSTPLGGTTIVSVRVPEQPVKLGQFNLHYVHDTYVRSDTMFAAGIFGDGLSIVDVHDKLNPTLIKTIRYPGAGTHNAWTTEDGSYVLTTDEIGTTPKTLKIWDIRNISSVSKVGEWTPRPQDIVHNVMVKGNYAYTAYYKAGLMIADISDKRNPVTTGFYDTFPDTGTVGGLYNGAWGIYPFLLSGRILISDMSTGLYVFEFDQEKIGKVVGIVLDARTGKPLNGAIIRIKETGQTRWTNAQGRFIWGYAVGNYNLVIEKDGYQTSTMSVSVLENTTKSLTLALTSITPPPTEFHLYQNYPNPFNSLTHISFDLPQASDVTLIAVDALGRRIATLFQGRLGIGRQSVSFDASAHPSGVYFYTLQTTGFRETRRMILIK